MANNSNGGYETIWTDKKRTLFGLPLSFTRYILTEKKFITRKGFLSITEDEIELYRVVDKSLRLPFGQRIFGCGTVIINCRDTDTPVKEVVSIKNPRDFMNIFEKQVDIQRDKYRTRGRDMMASDIHMGCDHDDYDD
ncbi:MAG: PH domain-containing protein [Oscillospiraceae bacterium]|nr:PH domain-containing protein [Oscillospiraceae bacterium]